MNGPCCIASVQTSFGIRRDPCRAVIDADLQSVRAGPTHLVSSDEFARPWPRWWLDRPAWPAWAHDGAVPELMDSEFADAASTVAVEQLSAVCRARHGKNCWGSRRFLTPSDALSALTDTANNLVATASEAV